MYVSTYVFVLKWFAWPQGHSESVAVGNAKETVKGQKNTVQWKITVGEKQQSNCANEKIYSTEGATNFIQTEYKKANTQK